MVAWLAPVAESLGALTQLAGTIFSMTQGVPGISSEEAAYRDWTRAIEPAGTAMNKMFYNPVFAGQTFPFAEHFNLPAGARTTQWAPTSSTQRLYSSYLNRQYGLPTRVGKSMSAQAMQPVRYQGLDQNKRYNPAGAREAYKIDPQVLAQTQISRKEPEALRQLDYLRGAGELSQYNLWKTQQVPRLIG